MERRITVKLCEEDLAKLHQLMTRKKGMVVYQVTISEVVRDLIRSATVTNYN